MMSFQVIFSIDGTVSDPPHTAQVDILPDVNSVVYLDSNKYTVADSPVWTFNTLPFPGTVQVGLSNVQVDLVTAT